MCEVGSERLVPATLDDTEDLVRIAVFHSTNRDFVVWWNQEDRCCYIGNISTSGDDLNWVGYLEEQEMGRYSCVNDDDEFGINVRNQANELANLASMEYEQHCRSQNTTIQPFPG